MEKFSILIANYNNGKYFIDCYNSLINQTYENWEVIIVDDASSDNSVGAIRNIIRDDYRFKLYENTANKGCGYTKKKCMDYSSGDICAYLDPDDALFPNAIKYSVETLRKNTKIVAVYSQVMFCDENLIVQKRFNKIKQIYNYNYFFNCPIQLGHLFAFRRKVYLKTLGINANLKSAVDQDLYLKILEHGNARFIKKPLYKYRLHARGISQESSKENAKISFAKVILESMHRRGLKKINNKKVPNTFNNHEEIFSLLDYQIGYFYRLKMKIIAIIQNF